MLTPELYRKELLRGMFTRVATDLGIGRSHVSRVGRRERRSPRVEAALKRESDRIERVIATYRRNYSKWERRAA